MGPAWSRPSLLPAFAMLVLAAACGGEPGPDSEPKPDGTRGTPTPTMSVQEYQNELKAALDPLSNELARVPKSRGLPTLPKRLAEAERIAEKVAKDVRAMTPPPKASAAHMRLVDALDALAGDLSATADAVERQELCAPSSVLAELGDGAGFAALPEAVQALRRARVDVDLAVPATPKARGRSLPNGTFVRAGGLSGRGELRIDNGTEKDAVVSLVRGGRPAFSVYVRGTSRVTVSGVPDGTYALYYAFGTDWDRRAKAFTRHCGFRRFDREATFETTYDTTAIYHTIQELGLQPTANGNATTSDVAPQDFPR